MKPKRPPEKPAIYTLGFSERNVFEKIAIEMAI